MDPILADLLKATILATVPLVAVFITWRLTMRSQERQRKRETVAGWHRLLIEVTQCQERLRGVATNQVKSPLYRLPTDTYRLHFHGLMVASELAPADIDTFQRYYQFVDQVNDGLDLAALALQAHDDPALTKQYERNRQKAAKVVEKEGKPRSPYDDVRGAIFAQLQLLGDGRYVEWLKTQEAPRIRDVAEES